MKVQVVMPHLGESVVEGTVVRWLVQEGARVQADQPIVEISTDKVDTEIPSPATGTLVKILAPEGATVQVGAAIAMIETEVAALEERAALRFYSPLVMNIAEKEGITLEELSQVPGSGQEGRVTKKDLLRYLESRGAPPRPTHLEGEALPPGVGPPERVEVIPMDAMKRIMAEHMTKSLRTSAHATTFAEVDMSQVVSEREAIGPQFESSEGFRLTYTPFILSVAVKALAENPLMNSSVEGDKIVMKKYVNLGLAVATERGLIVPVIKGAEEKNLIGLARAAHDLAERARTRKLKLEEIQEGTFTVTNPGLFGNVMGTPIINQPQVAILGVGAVKKRPVVIDDAIAIRPMMFLSLSYDHRIIDGALAGRFLQRVVELLENFTLQDHM